MYILLFIDIINYKNFDSDLLTTDNKPYKNINIYYITYITKYNISGYQNIHSGNPFYLIIGEADGYIEEKNEKNTQFLLLQIKTMYLKVTTSTKKVH